MRVAELALSLATCNTGALIWGPASYPGYVAEPAPEGERAEVVL